MPKAYVPVEKVPVKYSLPVQPDETVIEKDKEFWLSTHRWQYSDGAVHNNVLYIVPENEVLFIEEVSVAAALRNDVFGWVHITTSIGTAGYYLGGVELGNNGSVTRTHHFVTPIKLLAGDQINGLAYQETAGAGRVTTLIILSGYTKANF